MFEFTQIPLTLNLDQSLIMQTQSGEIESCIGNVLDLIVFTPRGTFNADPDFGFEYWNHEFTNIDVREFNNSYMGLMSNSDMLNDISRQQCENSLRQSILTYEPRLLKPEVKIELEINNAVKRNFRSKYEIHILITGSIDDGLGILRQYEKKISFMVEPVAKKFSL